MTMVYDLSDFQGLDFGSDSQAKQLDHAQLVNEGDGIYSLNTFTTDQTAFIFTVPGRHVPGTKIKASVQCRTGTGDGLQLAIVSYENDDYQGSGAVTTVNAEDVVIMSNGDDRELVTFDVQCTVGPLRPFIQVLLGNMVGEQGIYSLRDFKVEIDHADPRVSFPMLAAPSFGARYSFSDLRFNWATASLSGGSVNINLGLERIELSAPAAGTAYIVKGHTDNIGDQVIEGVPITEASGIELFIDCDIASDSTPVVFVDYRTSAGGALGTREILLTGFGRAVRRVFFPGKSSADIAVIKLGFEAGNEGTMNLHGLSVKVYGGLPTFAQSSLPIVATVEKDFNYFLDGNSVVSGSQQFAPVRAFNVTQFTNFVRLTFEASQYVPHFIAQINGEGDQNQNHYVGCRDATRSTVDVYFYDRDTNASVPTASIPNGTVFVVMGIAAS